MLESFFFGLISVIPALTFITENHWVHFKKLSKSELRMMIDSIALKTEIKLAPVDVSPEVSDLR